MVIPARASLNKSPYRGTRNRLANPMCDNLCCVSDDFGFWVTQNRLGDFCWRNCVGELGWGTRQENQIGEPVRKPAGRTRLEESAARTTREYQVGEPGCRTRWENQVEESAGRTTCRTEWMKACIQSSIRLVIH